MNYFNKKNNILYCLGLPFFNSKDVEILFKTEQNREIKISNEITICSVNGYNSFLKKQCKKNNITLKIIRSDFVEDIINSLSEVSTKYTLICGFGENVIVNNLDENFISKFNSLNKPFCFAGTPTGIPIDDFENEQLYTSNGIYNHACFNLVFGETDKMIEFFRLFKTFAFSTMLDISPDKLNPILCNHIYLRNALTIYSKETLTDSKRELFANIIKEEYEVRQTEKDKVVIGDNFLIIDERNIL